MNLGQARIKTLHAFGVETLQVVVSIKRHKPGHVAQIIRQATFGSQPLQKGNRALYTAPAKHLQTGCEGLRIITRSDGTC